MTSRRLRELAVALAISVALFVAPTAIGLLARISSIALRRFWAWWPPESLQPLPLGVAGLVILVSAYALATRGHRMRSPGSTEHRRLLPPLDLLLLQLGNVTFLTFALVLAVVTLGLLSSALRALVGMPWLVANGFSASLAVAAAGALFGLRRQVAVGAKGLRRARHAAILGVAVGGFWLIGTAPEWSPFKIRWADSQIEPSTLAILYALAWILLAGCRVLVRLERASTGVSESAAPHRRLAPSVALAWGGHLGFVTLYLNGAFLTLRGHLA